MTSPYNTGPNAPERNPPIEPQYFQPSVFVISSITPSGPITTVVFTTDHNYVIGQLVRFLIPFRYGMNQINEQTAYVIGIPSSNTITVNLDSSRYAPFVSSPSPAKTLPQVVAVGDVNSGIISSTGRVIPITPTIPGSFINISPQ